VLLAAIYIALYYYLLKEATQSFDNVKDLMKGAIETDIVEMQDAYRHFKATPGINVIAIKDELREF